MSIQSDLDDKLRAAGIDPDNLPDSPYQRHASTMTGMRAAQLSALLRPLRERFRAWWSRHENRVIDRYEDYSDGQMIIVWRDEATEVTRNLINSYLSLEGDPSDVIDAMHDIPEPRVKKQKPKPKAAPEQSDPAQVNIFDAGA